MRAHECVCAHLEIGVFVYGAPCGDGDHPQRGHVHILVGEEEEVHTTSLGHALLSQAAVEAHLGLEQRLGDRHTQADITLVVQGEG